jgi:hypothetical protein
MTNEVLTLAQSFNNIDGFSFVCVEDGVSFYSKQLAKGKFIEMALLPEDLTLPNFRFMAKHNMTRTNEFVRKFQSSFRKKARS